MPAAFPLSLLALLGVLLVLRLVLPGLPLPAQARRLSGVDATLTALGLLGLLFHCAAMFARTVVLAVPGTRPVVDVVNALGWGSLVLFVIPAALLVLGLRRQRRWAWIVLTALLVAVGVTMYDHGSLAIHLVTIAATVTWLGVTGALLVVGAGSPRPVRSASSS